MLTENSKNKYKTHLVIPYSEVTNEIGNLLTARCSVFIFLYFKTLIENSESEYKTHPVIPYSEVTNAIGNLFIARCSVIIFARCVSLFK